MSHLGAKQKTLIRLLIHDCSFYAIEGGTERDRFDVETKSYYSTREPNLYSFYLSQIRPLPELNI